MIDFSVVLSVYKNDNPIFFNEAIESVLHQTCLPSEIILLADGPLSEELNEVYAKWETHPLIEPIRLPENVGRGRAKDLAIRKAKYPYVAIMDSDDISLPNRFELQLNSIEQSGSEMIGGLIEEFEQVPGDLGFLRKVPFDHNGIVEFSKKKQPFNHVTLMFKRDKYLTSGGYQNFRYIEDYDFIIRMILSGVRLSNLNDILVYVRFSSDQQYKRHGLPYFLEEKRVFDFMYREKHISLPSYIISLLIRGIIRFIPVKLAGRFYSLVLRKKSERKA